MIAVRAAALTAALTALVGAPAEASPAPAFAGTPPGAWTVRVGGGAAVPVYANAATVRGGGSLGIERDLARSVRLGLTASGQFGLESSQASVVAEVTFSLHLGRFRLFGGPRLGVAVLQVDWADWTDPVWTEALVTRLDLGAAVSLFRRWELSLVPVTVTHYYNKVHLLCWEPSVTLGYRF